MSELSVFIDESGDFGRYDAKSPYYIIGMVFHDQKDDISEPLRYLDSGLEQIGFVRGCVHVGPLIRRENEYLHMTKEERSAILRRMMNFTNRCEITQKAFFVEKKQMEDDAELAAKLSKLISNFIRENYSYFLGFDTVKIYYDNGQIEVTKIIVSIFNALLETADLRKAFPKDYRLSQVADLVCTAKLTELKMEAKKLSRSESAILGCDRDIRKNLLKPLKRKEFGK